MGGHEPVGGPEFPVRAVYDADADVMKTRVDDVGMVAWAVHEGLKQLIGVVDTVNADVFTQK